ncbi:MAG TPA: tail fiber domain-containing protein [Bacteroidales bacterium]|nr:tail fiber domain-containing protein [Bacteroidales bacterium]
MKKLLLSLTFTLLSLAFYAQIPQGFNYQAIARDGSGNPILNYSTLQVKLAVMADSGTTVIWEELFNPVSTNAFGMFTVVMGRGARQATSTVNYFSDINWTVTPKFLRTQVYYSGWKLMGITRLWSVPYALDAKNADGLNGALSRLKLNGAAVNVDTALFEVKNNTGQTIFAVYPEGVRMYVDNGTKGTKGGFAVGGFGSKAPSQPYLVVTSDSIRAYVDSSTMKGTNKGGFAVGGFGSGKGISQNLFYLSKKNYFIGHQSGINTNGGLYNSFIGYQTGMYNVTGSDNVFLGYQAGLNCTASYNVMVGYQAGQATTSGFNNIFLGYLAGYSNTTADNNVFIGSQTGYKTTSGAGNVFIGYYSGYSNTTGTTNSFVGNYSGYNNNGRYNAFLGYRAGYNNVTGNYNLYLGPYSGSGSVNASGSYNAFLGFYSGSGISTGGYNTFMGDYSGQSNTTGSYNAAIGFQSGRNLTTGQSNVFLGYMAGYYADSTSFNVFIGRESGYSNNAGTFNNFIGYQAGRNMTGGKSNTFIGYQAGMAGASAADSNNVMIGKSVGYHLTTGHDNIGLGNAAGFNLTTGYYNVMIGTNAGYTSSSGKYNTIIGYQAGENTTSDYGTMLGYLAGNASTSGFSQTMLGYAAGMNNTGSYNVMVGTCAGQYSTSGDYNTYVGLAAGYSNSGDNNVFIGHWAGYGEATSSNKLIVETNYTGTDNVTNALIYGDFSTNMLRLNGNVGIGVSPSYKFQVGVAGDGSQARANAWNLLSDMRLKKNITDIQNPVGILSSLHGFYFNWNQGTDNSRQLGLSAQEVEKVLPEIVSKGGDGYLSVEYSKLAPVLIEAIKDQQKTIKMLQEENVSLKDRLDKIENLVSTLVSGQK